MPLALAVTVMVAPLPLGVKVRVPGVSMGLAPPASVATVQPS